MAVYTSVHLWITITVILSVVDRSCGMVCLDGTTVSPNNGSSRRSNFSEVVVKTYLDIDVEQIPSNGEPDEMCKSSFRFTPHQVKIPQEVTRKLLIRQRQQKCDENNIMVNEPVVSANYNPYKTAFEVKGGVWTLFSEPAFAGCSITIDPSYGRIKIPFTVKSIKPNSAKGIKQYQGEYFVSLMDFNTWMRTAYPKLPPNSAHHPAFLNEMLWYDMNTQIFRQDGGLIRINEDGEVFPDHPFNEPPPFGETTSFFFDEFPAFFPDEPSVVIFQSTLNPDNFLGVRRNAFGDLELVADTDGFEASEFILVDIGVTGFFLLKSRVFCVFVAVDMSGPMPVFELLPDRPDPISRGSFILI